MMRKAAAASFAIHAGLIAGAWAFMQMGPVVSETDAESVSVDIISMDMVSTDPSEVVTESNQTLVSAGAEVEAMEVPEVAESEPLVAEAVQPVQAVAAAVSAEPVEAVESEEIASAEVLSAAVETAQPVAGDVPQIVSEAATIVAESVTPSQSDPLDAIRTATIRELTPETPAQVLPQALVKPVETIQPVQEASLSPTVEEITEVVPIPKPRIVREPVEARAEPIKEQPKAEQPKKQPEKKQPEKKPPSRQANLGNGGAADADNAASKKSGGGQGKKDDGGSAAASKYPGLVEAKVVRAAKYPKKAKGDDGEALVSFVVGASGKLVQVALARSSGNAALDDAAIAAVNRAAPFPPIPEAAGRSSWSFTVPLYFKK
ncbi:TonB family protein [Devosia sp. ZB163]|uniref:energy transducer TonB family protein n=1 Tax=Devosia sp. ZB163 TaxID=3025938 RepID=UPI002361EF70|nr:TonB family protein [Devosia sp. ZB163]MDC9823364.1 TonB family protein [Devosia sp. ZB163]